MSVQLDQSSGQARQGSRLGHFLKDNRGSIAILGALALPVLTVLAGGAVDYARGLSVREKMQGAVDSALLATVQHQQGNANISAMQLRRYFRNHLRASLPENIARYVRVARYYLGCRNGGMQARVHFRAPTYFLRIIGMNHLNMVVKAQTSGGTCPANGGGATGRTLLEVALVMDASTTLTPQQTRQMKKLGQEIVRYLDHRFGRYARVAVVPFSQYVNVGSQYRNAWWIDIPQDRVVGRYHCRRGLPGRPPHCIRDKIDPDVKITWEGCVGSRDYPWSLRDESYADRKVPGVMSYPRSANNRDPRLEWAVKLRNECVSASIMPLQWVQGGRQTLYGKIASIERRGYYNYVPIGLAWGWRVLSHETPFDEGAGERAIRKNKARKIIILMTAGKSTVAPANQKYEARNHTDWSRAGLRRADDYLLKLCNNIKATNPATGKRHAEIIAITFGADDKGKALMRKCASMGVIKGDNLRNRQLYQELSRRLMHLSRWHLSH